MGTTWWRGTYCKFNLYFVVMCLIDNVVFIFSLPCGGGLYHKVLSAGGGLLKNSNDLRKCTTCIKPKKEIITLWTSLNFPSVIPQSPLRNHLWVKPNPTPYLRVLLDDFAYKVYWMWMLEWFVELYGCSTWCEQFRNTWFISSLFNLINLFFAQTFL